MLSLQVVDYVHVRESKSLYLYPFNGYIYMSYNGIHTMDMNKERVKITREGFKCLRCGFEWLPKSEGFLPKRCANPKCRSPYWDKERTRR